MAFKYEYTGHIVPEYEIGEDGMTGLDRLEQDFEQEPVGEYTERMTEEVNRRGEVLSGIEPEGG